MHLLLEYTLLTLMHPPSDNFTFIPSDAWPQSCVFELHALTLLARRSPLNGKLMRHSAPYPGRAAIHPLCLFSQSSPSSTNRGFEWLDECDDELVLRRPIVSTCSIAKHCCVMNGYVRSARCPSTAEGSSYLASNASVHLVSFLSPFLVFVLLFSISIKPFLHPLLIWEIILFMTEDDQ